MSLGTPLTLRKFRTKHPLGTRARVAMEVIYWSGLRRGDAVQLGLQHVGKDGIARIRAEKTKKIVAFAFVQELKDVLAHGPVGDLNFITGSTGGQITKASFGNDFRDWCKQAGISKSAHGLRKLAATEVAEGCGSEMELKAMFGWSSDDQSAVYTRNARRDLLAVLAAQKRMKK